MIPRARLLGPIGLILWWAAGAATIGYVSGAFSTPDPRDVRLIGFHQPPESIDGRAASWVRQYSKIDLPDPGWRPLRVTVELHAPPEAGPTPATVEVGVLDLVHRRVEIGSDWTSVDIVIREASIGRRLELQVWSSIHGDAKHGVGVGAVRQTVVLAWREGTRVAVAGLLVGLVPWTLTSRSRRASWRRLGRVALSQPGNLTSGLLFLAVGFMPVLWLGTQAAHVWWLWVSVLALAAFGRLVRVSAARWSDTSFPLYRDPVFELTLGLSSAVAALYLLSFVVKRVLRLSQPIESLFPLAFVGVLVLGWTVVAARTRAIHAAERSRAGPDDDLIWTAADRLKLAAFFVVMAALGGPHLLAVHGYSTDPLQHIAWTNQIRLHGFVPDSYADTTLLIGYPLGCAAYAYVWTALTPLPPASGVNMLPVLASAAFIYVVVYGVGVLQLRSSPAGSPGRQLVDFLVFAALATALSSAQFGVWHYYEGTGRLSAGLVHGIPLFLLMDALYRWRRATDAAASGLMMRLCLLLLSGILLIQINPTHLALHGLLSVAVLLFEIPALAHRPFPLTRGVIFATAAAVGLALAIVLADSYWWRLASTSLRLGAVDDLHLRSMEADFLKRYQDRACLTPECIMRALEQVPKTESLVYPLKVVVGGPAVAVASFLRGTLLDSASINVTSGYPAPAHGLAPLLLLFSALGLILSLPHCGRSFLALIAILLAITGIDLTIRTLVGLLTGPGVPTLRLLPDYMTRASSVFFNQALWAALASGVYFALVRAATSARWRVPVLALWCLGVGAAGVSAVADLRAEWAGVRVTVGGRLTLQDVEDLLALERQVPAGESYLVSSSVILMGKENWIDSLLDEAASLYAQASRPSLFLFFQSYGAKYSATDFANICDELKPGLKYPQALVRHNARWMAEMSSSDLEHWIPEKTMCGRRVSELFPQYRVVARSGRIVLYRLW